MASWEDRVHRAPAAAHAFWGGASARSLIAPSSDPPSARPPPAAAANRAIAVPQFMPRPSFDKRPVDDGLAFRRNLRAPVPSHHHGAVERGFDAFAADAAAGAGERRALMKAKAASPQGRRPTTTMVGMYDEEYPPEYPPPPRSPPRLAPSPSPTRAVSPGRAPVVGAPRDNNVGEILLHDYEGRPASPERPTSPSMTFAAGMTAEVVGGEPLKESLLMGPDYTMPYTPCSTSNHQEAQTGGPAL